MSVATGTAIAIGATAAASIGGAAISAHAAGSAADKQAQSAQTAIDFQKQVFDKQQQNLDPYLQAGKSSIGTLMQDFENGTFGPGSIPAFKAPTAEEARATPGYQFTQQEGQRGVLNSAAARGAGMSGGTLRALDRYNTGLADSTYGDTFSRALQQYQAALAGQQQGYNQLAGVVQTGLGAATGVNQAGTAAASNIGSLMTQQGNAQAAGTVGAANAWNQGIGNATNDALQIWQLSQMDKGGMATNNIGAPMIGTGLYGASPGNLDKIYGATTPPFVGSPG